MGEKHRKMTLNDLMTWLGDCQPGSIAHNTATAEYERRKFFWQRVAVVIASIGLVVAIAGVIVGALHLK